MRGAHWRGPHLGIGTDAGTSAGDPANGERVARCRTCGLPENGLRLHRFQDRVEINGVTYAVSYGVCVDCILRSNPRPIADPLDVTTPI